tara:strand:- start:240 stop:1217 length:978 start_codon:yes stop_codon:yes gene_type:complete
MNNKVLLIGLGQIGAGYDINNLNSDHVLTHANAVTKHKNFQLIAGVDESHEKRIKFSNAYNIDSFKNIDNEIIKINPSIVIIATPTETHLNVIKQVLEKLNPKLILCEKPLAYTFDSAKEIVNICKKRKIELFVNYMRQSDPSTSEIKKMIIDNIIEKPIKANIWYSKGVFNNGSHLFNLLEKWLGQTKRLHLINGGNRVGMYDYEPDFFVQYEEGCANFLSSREEHFSLYTIELITKSGRLFYSNGGENITWQSIEIDQNYPEYKVLSENYKVIKNQLHVAQLNVLNNIDSFINNRSFDLCSGDQALETVKNINEIVKVITHEK